jgi:hypothetical protein
MPDTYNDAIVQTFRKNAIHTALLVDDKFPTYKQLCDLYGQDANGDYQTELSNALYSTFVKNDIPCDIENDVDKIRNVDLSRLRKSDLIILDYHLEEDDSSASIEVIKKLAKSKHFNLVVLYTSEEPSTAWLEVAAHLRQGWDDKEESFDDDKMVEWELFDYEIIEASDVIEYIKGNSGKVVTDILDRHKEYLDDEDIPQRYRRDFIEAAIHWFVQNAYGDEVIGGNKCDLKSNCSDGTCWLQCHNLFLVIKQKDDSKPENEDDPKGIIDAIDKALIDWKPNPFQIMISNIQNILECEGLATDSEYFGNENFQMGLAYSMASQISEVNSVDKVLDISVGKVLEDLLDFLQHRTTKKVRQQQIVHKAFGSRGAKIENTENVEDLVKDIIGVPFPQSKRNEILFARNSFVSTREFAESHVTNGTIFRLSTEEGCLEYWVCVYPSCDLVPRIPKEIEDNADGEENKDWREELYPYRPFTAVKLNPSEGLASIKKATHARTIFLKCEDACCFEALPPTDIPKLETMFGVKALEVFYEDGKTLFTALRIESNADESKLIFNSCTFEIVGQLRPAYASRLLTKVSHHKARIGLDYIAPH